MPESICHICKLKKPAQELFPVEMISPSLRSILQMTHPDLLTTEYICLADLNLLRVNYIQTVLKDLQNSSVTMDSITRQEQSLLIHIPEIEMPITFGERVSDKMAEFGGSWKFLGLFSAIMIFWIVLNTVTLLSHPFDPFPFILLNLVLSCIAAVQAPIIMMSQNRQEKKDRIRAENDYMVNLKSELEIRQLHTKLDMLITHQWKQLIEIQEVQIEMMNTLFDTKKTKKRGSISAPPS